jgi:8-oxo-dGTP pyrophosphatase MutT (NUDIX family)
MGKKMFVTCGIFLIDGKNRLLIVHPTNLKDFVWEIPKGLKEPNETAWEAAKRELKEETGIDINSLNCYHDYMGMIPYKHKKKMLLAFYVKCKNVLSTKAMHCDSTFIDKKGNCLPEIDRFELVNKDIAIQVVHETQKQVWGEYFDI